MDTIESTQPRRVKVYSLQGDRWIDKGTGYCSGEIDSMEKIPQFIVRNELNYSEILLKANIQGNTQYQRQQDTLIVWTDLDGDDYALSFQEPEGCLSLCEFLINVQNTLEPNISLVAVTSNGQDGEITEVIAGPIPEPPEPNNDNLFEILELIGQGSKSIKFKETILEFIENKNYLIKLIEIFEKNELNKNLTNLYYLCDIIKALIFYNDSNILEKFLNDNIIIGIVGILEYDPDFLNFKSNHRDYLIDETKFKEVIPLKNNEIRDLIKKTFRLQFLKDVVLARLLDDSTFNCISTMIHINYDRIINFLINSNDFLPELFNLYNKDIPNNNETIDKKRDGIKMIQQFVLVAKKFQPSSRSEFYKSLIDKGLFKMITFAFKDTEIERI
ncbi:unnamed protein product [[Candida] boidinii]|uniref:Unnamed protein product n=1 Tax=Candida boidinii TaxID=5477 RepID=A0A9W6WJX6_CANBO|nr:unnamed protein product [[Candida] boidinii]